MVGVVDVVVVGGGPAGRALAAACGEHGLRTVLVDRSPAAPWRATYGSFTDQLPSDLPASCVAATARGQVVARTRHDLGRDYTVLDVAGLRTHLDARMSAAGVEIRAGRVHGASPGHLRGATVHLTGGDTLLSGTVVDAGGHRRPLATPTPGVRAEQTAYGVLVDEAAAAPLVAPGTALFMDWRNEHGAPGPPSFLYGVPVGGGAVLLEETSLAARPGIGLPLLRARLRARLAHHGVRTEPEPEVERVRFPLDLPRHRTPGVVGFGAAAPFVHPASGFSLATALRAAPVVAAAIAEGGSDAAERAVWPGSAVAVHRVRRIGLEALLRMPPELLPGFFEVFFGLPERHQRAYLDGRTDLVGLTASMGALFRASGWDLRRRLVGPALRGPAAPSTGPFG